MTAYEFLRALAYPSHALLLLALAGVVLSPRLPRAGRALALAALSALLASGLLPVGAWLAAPLEARHPRPDPPPARVDGIVVLGGYTDPGAPCDHPELPLNDAAERLTEALVLARRHPRAKLLVSGGGWALDSGECSEAELTGRFLARLGFDADRLLLETRSRNTRENALFSRELADPRPGEVWLLVTSAMHMPRALAAFRAVGFDVVPWPVDFAARDPWAGLDVIDMPRNWRLLDRASHEWLGLLWYRWRGWIGDSPQARPTPVD